MYLRAVHAEANISALRDFIRDNPLGLIITALQSLNSPTIQCTHIQWVLDVIDEGVDTEHAKLRGHMARANPHSKALIEEAGKAPASSSGSLLDQEVSILFTGPTHSYVTPQFYVKTKPATGKVVPTWNYSAVQAYGRARIFCDSRSPETASFLQRQISDLSRHSEEDVMLHNGENGNPPAWEVSDAPANFIEQMKKAIIGIEVDVERLEGKYKMSQELGEEDREGVVKGFEALGTEEGVKMARLVEERGAMKNGRSPHQ